MGLSETEELEMLRLRKRKASVQTAGEPLGSPSAEAATSLLSGAVAGPVSGLAGLAGAVLPGPEGQGADWVKKTQEAMTYEPRSQMGKNIVNTVAAPAQYLSNKADQAGQDVTDFAGPTAGTIAKTGLEALPMALAQGAKVPVGKAFNKAQAESAATASKNSVLDTTLANARSEGYVVPSSAVNPTFLGNRLESVAGKAATGQEASIRNQQVTNKIARREASLPEDSPITEGTLAAARDQLAQPYQEVAALSPTAAKKLELLKEARFEAKGNWQYADRTGDPKAVKEAKKWDNKAQRLESDIDTEAQNSGNLDLVTRLQEARKALAKNYTVERALNVGSGDVDAGTIGRLLDKGAPLSGGLETIGRFNQAFKRYSREGTNVPAAGVGKTEAIAGATLGAVGHATGVGLWPAGLPLLSGPARSLALSNMMQGPRTYQPGMSLQLLNKAAQNPGVFSAIPDIGENQEMREWK